MQELPEVANNGVGTQQTKQTPSRQIYSKEKKEKNKSKRVKKNVLEKIVTAATAEGRKPRFLRRDSKALRGFPG